MIKNSRVALSTIGLIAGANALHTLPPASSNCTGYFYEDINAAFTDCFDSNGVLVSREENFFKSMLGRDCSNTTFSALQESLSGSLMQDLDADTSL
jgi:hypothetical protein